MAFTIKERLANRKILDTKSLEEIYKEYGYRDLLKREIEIRLEKNIEEVRYFYKNHNPEAYMDNYQQIVYNLSNKLKLDPIELLSWKCFQNINDEIAREFLLNNELWVNNPDILAKVSENFLAEFISKKGITKYPQLLEKLSPFKLKEIILDKTIILSSFSNLEKIIEQSLLSEQELKTVIEKLISENNYVLATKLFPNLSNYLVEEIILNIKNTFSIEEYLKFLDCLPQKTIEYLNKDEYFFEKLIANIDLEKILNSSFINKLSDQNIKNILLKLPLETQYELMIKNNELYLKCQDIIDYTQFCNKINDKIDSWINYLEDSLLLQEFIKKEISNVTNVDLKNSFQLKYNKIILNNPKLLDYCFQNNLFLENFSIESKLKRKEPLTEIEQESIIGYIDKLDLSTEELLEILRNYPVLKEKLLNSKQITNIISKWLENELKLSNVMLFLQEYPECMENIDINKFLSLPAPLIMAAFDKFPQVAQNFMQNRTFLTSILSSKEKILSFIPLLNKYNITNSDIQELNANFQKIREFRPELSWGNTSLKLEFLDSSFINILGGNYINAILQFDSDASKIVCKLFKEGKLPELKKWLDYLTTNISNNNRMVHFYILGYSKTEELARNLMATNVPLTDYQKQILEEIIEQDNCYNIKNLDELNRYFEIKAYHILNSKAELTTEEVYELFLNNSALTKGVPWNQSYNLMKENLDYYKYKYVDTGIMSIEEYNYLVKVKNIIANNNDMALIQELIGESIGKELPTARSIIKREIMVVNKEFNSKLLDIDELRNIASYTDPKAEVYIEIIDGIECIHLNGYDYKCLSCSISKNDGNKQNATFSNEFTYDFEQYRIFSEEIKEKAQYENLSSLAIGNLIYDDPENWNLIEGVSTISTGMNTSRTKYATGGGSFGWGKRSNLEILGCSGADAGISHDLRNLMPNKPGMKTVPSRVLYGTDYGETWFDRYDKDNKRVAPEFMVISGDYNIADIPKDQKKAAKYFKCPVIVVNSELYRTSEECSQKLDLKSRKKFLETFDVNLIDDIIYNSHNKDSLEKITFILNTLLQGVREGKIDLATYYTKLIDLKWKLYERNLEQYIPQIDEILGMYQEENRSDTFTRGGYINFIYLWLFIISTIIIGVVIGTFLLN